MGGALKNSMRGAVLSRESGSSLTDGDLYFIFDGKRPKRERAPQGAQTLHHICTA